jgi:hypothetical protein
MVVNLPGDLAAASADSRTTAAHRIFPSKCTVLCVATARHSGRTVTRSGGMQMTHAESRQSRCRTSSASQKGRASQPGPQTYPSLYQDLTVESGSATPLCTAHGAPTTDGCHCSVHACPLLLSKRTSLSYPTTNFIEYEWQGRSQKEQSCQEACSSNSS